MTDLETAREALKPVVTAISIIDSQFKILNAIVGKNQNRPPLGDADGSFSDENWTMLRDIVDAIITIKQNSPCV